MSTMPSLLLSVCISFVCQSVWYVHPLTQHLLQSYCCVICCTLGAGCHVLPFCHATHWDHVFCFLCLLHSILVAGPGSCAAFVCLLLSGSASDRAAGGMFPASYNMSIINAQHGSWDRTPPLGYRVMVLNLNSDGLALNYSALAEGWLLPNGTAWGEFVQLQFLPSPPFSLSQPAFPNLPFNKVMLTKEPQGKIWVRLTDIH